MRSPLVPSTQLVHLGVEWNFASASVRPPPAKSVTMATEATHLAASHSVTLPRLESFLGKLVALKKLVQYGRTHLRGIQALLLLELRVGRTFRWVTLTDDAKADMRWWSDRGSSATVDPLSSPETRHTHLYRYVDTRLGLLVQLRYNQWSVVEDSVDVAHQRLGDEGDPSGSSALVCQLSRSVSSHFL